MSLTRISLVAGVLLTTMLSGTAAAQGNFYVFGALGNTDSDVALGGLNRVDDDNSSYALGAGYVFTPNLSLEVAYQDFSDHDGQTDCPPGFACLVIPVVAQADVAGISLALVGSVPLTDRLGAYGKVGFISWDVEYDGISSAFDDSSEDLLYAAGVNWSINDRWKVFAEYQRVELDLDTAAVGVSFHF